MEQSKLMSFIESVCNVGSGFVLSMVLWQLVVSPAFGYDVTLGSNLALTSIFTSVSVARGYAWRRFFSEGLHRVVAQILGRVIAKPLI